MTCPLGVEQLISCNEVTMENQIECCKTAYAVTAPHLGHILRVSGVYQYKVRDAKDDIIARFIYLQGFCERATMAVHLADSPPILLKPESSFSRTICFWEQERPVLRMKLVSMWTRQYTVFAENDAEVASIKRSWGDYIIKFPLDLDVRYKAALLAACVYLRLTKR